MSSRPLPARPKLCDQSWAVAFAKSGVAVLEKWVTQNEKKLAQSVVEPLAGLCDHKHIANLIFVQRTRLN
jgi:hypothetical protein